MLDFHRRVPARCSDPLVAVSLGVDAPQDPDAKSGPRVQPPTRVAPGLGPGASETANRVLWIDDETDAVKPLAKLLEYNGFNVHLARDAASGLAVARQQPFDIIVLDWKLPDVSGMEVLRTLRAEGNNTAVLVPSGFATVDLAVEALRQGATDVKSKPLRGAALVGAIRDAMARAGPRLPKQPMFGRFVAGTPAPPVREVLQYLGSETPDTRGSLESGSVVHAEDKQLCRLFARVLPDPDVTFFDFVAAAGLLRRLVSEKQLTIPTGEARALIARASERDPDRLDARVRHLLARLETAGATWPTVTEVAVASELGLSRTSLWRLLQDEIGLTLPACRRAVVMRRAIRALATTDEHVRQIAYQAGYQDASQFDHDFLRFLGMAPTPFRRQLRGA
jgi:DNA-binding response OmpR family regulator/AraC-like DNA-binding protein